MEYDPEKIWESVRTKKTARAASELERVGGWLKEPTFVNRWRFIVDRYFVQ